MELGESVIYDGARGASAGHALSADLMLTPSQHVGKINDTSRTAHAFPGNLVEVVEQSLRSQGCGASHVHFWRALGLLARAIMLKPLGNARVLPVVHT